MDRKSSEKCAHSVWICGRRTENRSWIEVYPLWTCKYYVHTNKLHCESCVFVFHVWVRSCLIVVSQRNIQEYKQQDTRNGSEVTGRICGVSRKHLFKNVLHREMHHQCCLEHRYLFLPEGGVTGFK